MQYRLSLRFIEGAAVVQRESKDVLVGGLILLIQIVFVLFTCVLCKCVSVVYPTPSAHLSSPGWMCYCPSPLSIPKRKMHRKPIISFL